MKKAVWISYDLGIKGDFQGLYSWLDDHDAIECGNSLAYIEYEVDTEKNLLPKLKKDLEASVEFKQSDRIYIIRREVEKSGAFVRGRFIIGNRKSSPWKGYGSKTVDTIDGNE